MRKTLIVPLLIVTLAFAAALLASDAKSTSVKGEIIDTFCYTAMGAKGESHAKCGIDCAKKGIPVGLLEGNKMYILLPQKDKSSLPDAVIDKMGKVVTVTGKVSTSGGNNFLTVESVK